MTDRGSNGQRRKWVPILLAALPALLMACSVARLTRAAVQGREAKNPFAGDAAAIKEGESLFRTYCAACHGVDARGALEGPSLVSGLWTHGDSDAAIFRTIAGGIPGTEMTGQDLAEKEMWMIIAYLRSVGPKARPPAPGNRENGERIFFGKGQCLQCHMVNGRGGRLGPDLSYVGASRSVQYLIDSIREPSKDLSEGLVEPNNKYGFPIIYDTVIAVTKDGRRITGAAKNEDTFTLQLMDQNEQLHLFLKSELAQVIHERKSLMPAYDEGMLSASELQDLVAYLDSLRGL